MNVQQVAEELARKAEEIFGAHPSNECILRLARAIEDYALFQKLPRREFHEACARVARAIEEFRQALADSAKYNETLAMAWELHPEAENTLTNVQHLADGLATPRSGRPRNQQLRFVIDIVFDAYWSLDSARIGKLGINTRGDDTRYGPVLEMVKAALKLADVRVLPSDSTIRSVAIEVLRTKIVQN